MDVTDILALYGSHALFSKFMGGDSSKLSEESQRLDILDKKRRLGMNIQDDDDYENMLNDGGKDSKMVSGLKGMRYKQGYLSLKDFNKPAEALKPFYKIGEYVEPLKLLPNMESKPLSTLGRASHGSESIFGKLVSIAGRRI